jgi:PKHD-type hydroxylase
MYRILQVLSDSDIAECRRVAAEATFVDGKISNPQSTAKKNEQLHEPAAYKHSSELLKRALTRSAEFIDFAFPVAMALPMMARYRPGMEYGAHADSAFIQLPGATIRSDISCTIFLNDPADYDGGELQVRIGDTHVAFKLKAGEAILYPSDTLHEVLPVTRGERLVAITFIQSRIQDPVRRNLLYELRTVGAIEGSKMDPRNHARLQLIEQNLLRRWADMP